MGQCASCQTTRLVACKVMRNDDVCDCVPVYFIIQSHFNALILPFRPCMMMLSIERVTSCWRFFYKLHVLWDVSSCWKPCRAKKQTTYMAILRIKQSICWCRTWNIHIYEFILVLLGNLTEFKNKQFSLTLCYNEWIYLYLWFITYIWSISSNKWEKANSRLLWSASHYRLREEHLMASRISRFGSTIKRVLFEEYV